MGTFFAALALVMVVTWFVRRARPPEESRWTVPGLTTQLDRLEILLLQREIEFAASTLNQIEPPVLRIQGPGGNLLRARLRLAAGDFFAWTDRPDPARAQFEQALTEIDGVTEPQTAIELRTRAGASLGLLGSVEAPDDRLISHARAALENEPRVRRPEVVMRLVWLAKRLGESEHLQGRWPEARALFERAVAIGRRLERPGEGPWGDAWDAGARELFWSHGRKVASEAARDLALILESLGDREGTMRWLDEAVALVEGAVLPVARLRLVRGLHERATHEPVDAFTGIAHHESLLARAVEVALASETDEGRTAACVAELARAGLYRSVGMTEKRLEHLRRALELTDRMTEPAGGYNRTYLELAFGQALEDHGERAAATEALARAVERGRGHPDPDAREVAAQAAYRLYQLYFEEGRVPEAGRCVEVLEQLTPTLAAADRTGFASASARCRGQQAVLEGRLEDAGRSLEHAETLARQANALWLVRAVTMDQGRLSLRMERPEEALAHLSRALEIAVPQEDPLEERAWRAQIVMAMADTLMALDRPEEALRECRRAFDMGRDGGTARGREVAAIAAMHLGEAAADEVAERRHFYEIASQLGRLSGLPQGREVANLVDARLRGTAD